MSVAPTEGARVGRTVAGYLAMLTATAGLFALIHLAGRGLQAPVSVARAIGTNLSSASAAPDTLLHVLLVLAIVIVASRLLGALFRCVHQPPVIGEILVGLLLGPSVLGMLSPGAAAFLLPPSVAPSLQLLAQLGIILFMFVVGLELDTRLLAGRAHAVVAISHASIALPFLLGSALALWLYPILSSSDVPFPVFAMFLGVAMSVTAFPVLARILADRGLQRTRLGVIALSCAAVDDVTAWCLLAVVASAARASDGSGWTTLALSLVFVLGMLAVARPLLRRLSRAQQARGQIRPGEIAMVLVAVLLASLATEAIGIHSLFGAFLLGSLIPRDSLLARELRTRLEDLVVVLLLPAFFAFTGLRTQLGLLDGLESWGLCGAIILVACAGKCGGTFAAARLTGFSRRESASLGVLMNTRGLMELVVLNVGLDLGVISPALFTMMVMMALVTTAMAAPALHWLDRGGAVGTPGAMTLGGPAP